MIKNVENNEKIKELKKERDKLKEELERIRNIYIKKKELLEKKIKLWKRYEIKYENVEYWMKEKEGKVR